MADVPAREYRVDPDTPERVVTRGVGPLARNGDVLWTDVWMARYLRDEDVADWPRLVPEVDYNVMRDAVTDLGGVVQAACDELGIHHDTTPAEVVRAIRQARRG